jgi:hypothetical protein
MTPCQYCGGDGFIETWQQVCCGNFDDNGNCCEIFDSLVTSTTCPVCAGSGIDPDDDQDEILTDD